MKPSPFGGRGPANEPADLVILGHLPRGPLDVLENLSPFLGLQEGEGGKLGQVDALFKDDDGFQANISQVEALGVDFHREAISVLGERHVEPYPPP